MLKTKKLALKSKDSKQYYILCYIIFCGLKKRSFMYLLNHKLQLVVLPVSRHQ